jgi:hypothetical protein
MHRANPDRMAPVREFMKDLPGLSPDIPRPPSGLDVRAGGDPILGRPKSKAVETVQRLIRTIVFLAIFLFVCKLTHFRQKMLYDARVNRRYLAVFYGLCATFLALYAFMLFKFRILRPKSQRVPVDDWDKVAPIPLYTASGCLMLAVISFVFALWPCFQFGTLLIGTLGFMTLIFVMQWFPI